MLINNIKLAFRKLSRQKAFTAINIVGLSLSLTGALLIYMYVRNELSYDRFNTKVDRIYRINAHFADPGDEPERFSSIPPVMGTIVRDEIPEFETMVSLQERSGARDMIVKIGEEVYNESEVYQTDSGFFNIFTAPFLQGNPDKALTQPNSVVLSASTATKYFGDAESAYGKSIEFAGDSTDYLVTGVAEDFPANAHFHYHILISTNYSQQKYNPENWLAHSPIGFVLLAENADPKTVQEKLIALTDNILDPIYKKRFGKSYQEHKKLGGMQEYHLQPLADVHLHSADMEYDYQEKQGNIWYIYIFIGIGLILIGIASFNYINLSTAQSSREAKTAGVRKVLGANPLQLYKIFLTESVGVTLIAALVAITASQIIFALDQTFLVQFIPAESPTLEASFIILALALLIGLASGLAPARIVNAFQPVEVLKGQLARGQKGNRLRKMLVIAQFTVSMCLIICTFLISQQLDFMQHLSLGFDKENLLVINNIDKLGKSKETLKEEIKKESFVKDAALCYNALGDPHNFAAFTPKELKEEGKTEAYGLPVYIGDQDYLETLGVELIMGHNFSPNLTWDNKQLILNEAALREVGWQNRKPEDLIGKTIDINGLEYELAGVVKDYNFLSLKNKIGPLGIFSHYYQGFESLMIRVKPGFDQQALQSIQHRWQAVAPDLPFDYSFVDQNLDQLYRTEQSLATLFRIFSGLAIFIACLGLLGLAMFSVERRVKEIGVRKVMGASVQSLSILLSKEMMQLILLAFLVACPISWYLMHNWLDNFAYKIPIRALTFLLAGGLTLLVALVTMSFQTIKAALANPVKSLRNE